VIYPTKRTSVVFVAALVAALGVAGVAGSSPSIGSKEAEAQEIIGQINSLDAELGVAIEAYNAAQVRLDEIKAEQRVNERRLRIAKRNLGRAQANLSERLVALYRAGEQSAVEVILGATTLDELLDRADAVERVSEQDARIVREVRAFRTEVKRREAELRRARAQQADLVAQRAAHRAQIETQLAERERLLSSVRDEIARMQAVERRRQEQLAQEAENRLGSSGGGGGGGGSGAASSGADFVDSTFGGGGSPPPAQYGGVVGIAMQYLGIPYRWGGASPSTGFDCSGFVMYVYAKVGVSLPHNAAMQYGYGSPVSFANLAPGDLVFFNGLGHNGIYIGGGQFIHSPHTGDVVKISSMSGWYSSTFVGGRRL
jgi:cell wall-associated NlpC family hydrolase